MRTKITTVFESHGSALSHNDANGTKSYWRR